MRSAAKEQKALQDAAAISGLTPDELRRHYIGQRPLVHLYFIMAGPVAYGTPVKIGVAEDPRKRLMALQTSNPERLRLVVVCAGDRKRERELHTRFADKRMLGEWFRFDAEINEEMLRLAEGSRHRGCQWCDAFGDVLSDAKRDRDAA